MGRKMIVGNWKEHPATAREAKRLFDATAALADVHPDIQAIVCPPAIYLGTVVEARKAKRSAAKVPLGAQDVFYEEKGAFTGAIGSKMLRSMDVEYVIIGHSERRKWFGETDAVVAKKVAAAHAAGLRVILCVGEPPEVRKKGVAAAKHYLAAQVSRGIKQAAKKGLWGIIVAYEPIWAIGSGRNDDPRDAAEVAAFIRKTARMAGARNVKVLYGGSVNDRDVGSYIGAKEIDGALVGGASVAIGELKKLFKNL